MRDVNLVAMGTIHTCNVANQVTLGPDTSTLVHNMVINTYCKAGLGLNKADIMTTQRTQSCTATNSST